MTTQDMKIVSAIEALELQNRKLRLRISRHLIPEIRADSLAALMENMQRISKLRRKLEC